MTRHIFPVAAAVVMLMALSSAAYADGVSVISSNFNGTSIAPGNSIWFNSHMNVSGVSSSQPTTISITNITVSFGGNTYSIPSAIVTFDPAATTATTVFDTGKNAWVTIAPSSMAGKNVFMTGLALKLPNGLAGGQNPVDFQATFSSSTPGVSINWQWGAAAYTNLSTDYNALGVTAIDGSGLHAGTPVNFERNVIGGARGGGGSNFTGSWSATGHTSAPVATTPPPSSVPEPATMVLFGAGLAGIATRLRRRRGTSKSE